MKIMTTFTSVLTILVSLSFGAGGWSSPGAITSFTVIDSNIGRVCEVTMGGTSYVFPIDDAGGQAKFDLVRTAWENGANLRINRDFSVTVTYTPDYNSIQNKLLAIGVAL